MFGNDCYGEYIFNSTLEWPIQQILVGMQFNIKQMLSADRWQIVKKKPRIYTGTLRFSLKRH